MLKHSLEIRSPIFYGETFYGQAPFIAQNCKMM